MGAAWLTRDPVEKLHLQRNGVKPQPRASGYSLSPKQPRLQRAAMRVIFSKAKISLQTRDIWEKGLKMKM